MFLSVKCNEKWKPNCCSITSILLSTIELSEHTPSLEQDKEHTHTGEFYA